MLKQLLLSNWSLKQRDSTRTLPEDFAAVSGWLPAHVPGTVHQDLLASGHIPDPFVGLNERAVQWVGESDWLYRCVFDLAPGISASETIMLCFDGLDTFATVWLNGQQMLVSDNMFLPQRLPVGHVLRPEQNELRVLFESAAARARLLEARYGAQQAWNGDPSRVYVRKAQYQFGWDWGPCLLTAGLWRPVYLEAYQHRIAEVHCPIEVAADLGSATLPVQVTLEARPAVDEAAPDVLVHVALHAPAGDLLQEMFLSLQGHEARQRIHLDAPQLWWPLGYGSQPLYRLVVTLQRKGEVLDRRELRLGLRRLRLLQEPLNDEPGTTFLFEVNNTPIFCGGANWIPADAFPPRVEAATYRALVQAAADANMTMLRVWGGGIYEEDIFYDLCDELGLLVWQDFMFACGIYPAHNWFQASVRAEAEANVRRLRHHPCLALWCGNNEDYQVAQSITIYRPAFQGDFTATPFPARELYERLLPAVCEALDPARPYWPGSPYGGADVHDPTVGDRHIWDVWHGEMADYHAYPQFTGRFISEFGMQALPDLATIASFATAEERYPQSQTLEYHNKAADGQRRLALYLSDNLRIPADLDGFIYATQFLQAEALAAAYQGWRRQWKGPGRYATAGVLVWQLNDCWPATSWSIIDSHLRPKPAYYVVRRELAPLTLGLERTAGGVEVWAVNGLSASMEARLEVSVWALDGQQVKAERHLVSLAPQQATECGTFARGEGQTLVFGARLVVHGAIAARRTLWPEPFKYLRLPDPCLEVARLDGERLRLRVAKPAKGVLLTSSQQVKWSDNFLDLLPDEDQEILAEGLGAGEIQVRWLR
jgi:beta-mannosidase